MSWIAASTAVLAIALAAGFAWYERARPTTRVLALVATLAALAALGRIAFAPLPNVKPTTDIVLISGYVLGAGPGFVVGAVAALASNLFFGQGPWTPWQMAGWGGVGLAGAALARLTRRRVRRTVLAAASALAGLGFGAVMNLHLWVTYSGDHTLAKLGATFATSLPFDVAHAAGNIVFCLAFGPALIAALERFRTRMEVTWRPAAAATEAGAARPAAGRIAATTLLVAAAGLAVAAPAPSRADERADTAAAARASQRYLLDAQNRDGGWGGAPGQRSNQLHTGWTALGVAASGRNPRDAGDPSAIDYTRAHARDLNDLGELSRTILVYVAAGLSPRDVGGRDLIAELVSKRRVNGSFAGRVNTTAFALMALRAAGRSTASRPVRAGGRWLATQANRDGGFNFAGRGGPSGIDDTGAAVQGLVAAGRRGTNTVRRAVRFLVRRQNADGGFPLVPGATSNAQSTAWAVQAFLAAGREPARVRRAGSRDPLAYLRSLTAPSGEVRYSRTSRQTPVWVTAQAVMALARKSLPLARVPRARRSAPPAPAATPTATPRASADRDTGTREGREDRPRAARERARSRGAGSRRDPEDDAATGAAVKAPPAAAPPPPARALAVAAISTAVTPDRARAAGYAAGLAAAALL